MATKYPWLTGALLGIVCLLFFEWSHAPDGRLHFHMFYVGQGDGMLMITPKGKQIVIDGGPNTDLLSHLGRTMPFFDRTVDLLVLSHPDADHITALPDVLRRYRVEKILLNGTRHDSGRYEALLSKIQRQRIPLVFADPAQDIDMGDGVVLDVVWPRPNLLGTKPKHSNDQSVVMRVLYKDHSILLAGDIEKEAEAALLATGAELSAVVLTSPHHGSKTSSSTGFLMAVQPELILISSGRDNRFGHPHAEVTKRYADLGILSRNTKEEGTLSLVFE